MQKGKPRFEIRIQEPGARAREFGLNDPVHVVWDNERGRAVPFGRYSSSDHAEKRLARELAKVDGDKEAGE